MTCDTPTTSGPEQTQILKQLATFICWWWRHRPPDHVVFKHQSTLLSFGSSRQGFEVLRVYGCVHSSSETDLMSVWTETKHLSLISAVNAACNKVSFFNTHTHTLTHTVLPEHLGTWTKKNTLQNTQQATYGTKTSGAAAWSSACLPSSLCSGGSDWTRWPLTSSKDTGVPVLLVISTHVITSPVSL